MRKTAHKLPRLTLRELNRATLARQLLLERARLEVVTAVERLAALQAQWAPSPYTALWSRITGFRRQRLWSAIESQRTTFLPPDHPLHDTASSAPHATLF